jgi:hypothetical protein
MTAVFSHVNPLCVLYLNLVHDHRDVSPVHFVGAARYHFIFPLSPCSVMV